MYGYGTSVSFHSDGGYGSGDWGHQGRPGIVGGSGGGGGAAMHRYTDPKTGTYTSFAKVRAAAARSHQPNTQELKDYPDGTKLISGGKVYTKLAGNGGTKWQDEDGNVIGSHTLNTQELWGKNVKVAIPRSKEDETMKGYQKAPVQPKQTTAKAQGAGKPTTYGGNKANVIYESKMINAGDITSTITGFSNDYDSIAKIQGFDTRPTIVTDDEFKNAATTSGVVLFRTMNSGKGHTASEYGKMLAEEDDYKINGPSYNRVLGQGTYFTQARGQNGMPSEADMHENRDHSIRGYGDNKKLDSDGHYQPKNAGTICMTATYDKSAKIANYRTIEKEFGNLPVAEQSKYYDLGVYAAAKGWDGVEHSNGLSGVTYTVIYNRSKLIIPESQKDYDVFK